MNNTEMLRMLIPKDRFKRRAKKKKHETFADAERNSDRIIERRKAEYQAFLAAKLKP